MKIQQFIKRLPLTTSERGKVRFGFFRLSKYVFSLGALIFAFSTSSILAQTSSTKLSIVNPQNLTGTTIFAIKNGPDAAVDVNITNQTDPDGLAAVGFKINYNPNFVTLADANEDYETDSGVVTVGPFLASSGKQVSCGAVYIDIDETNPAKKELSYGCVTLGPTPAGAMGSGILASINFKPGSNLGLSTLALKSTELVDNTQNTNLIPHTATNINVRVVKCADNNNDGAVRTIDITRIIQNYGSAIPIYDLDGNGIVLIPDITAAVAEYGASCYQ